MPEELYDFLIKQYGEDLALEIRDSHEKQKYVTLRVNRLKATIEEIKEELLKEKIEYEDVSWYKDALIIKNVREEKIRDLEIYNDGKIYMQSLSSMLPPIFLEPKEEENILDMCAAPGGKTTQIASMTENRAWITACEKNKIREERLKYNLEKQGVKCVNVMKEDARFLNDMFSFDKILLDAPCSGSGTKSINDIKDVKELVERCSKIQEQLLIKALKLIKPRHEIVYSTCSILSEENEDVLEKVSKKIRFEIVPIEKINEIDVLPTKLEGTICVKPNEYFEGFFVAKLRKI